MELSEKLRIGSNVKLVGQGVDIYVVTAHEKHNGILFYRLTEVGGLFLRSSLEPISTLLQSEAAPYGILCDPTHCDDCAEQVGKAEDALNSVSKDAPREVHNDLCGEVKAERDKLLEVLSQAVSDALRLLQAAKDWLDDDAETHWQQAVDKNIASLIKADTLLSRGHE
jgi:hypothetical protein